MREPGTQQRMLVGEGRRVARGHGHLVATEAVLGVAGHGHPLWCLGEESLRLAEPAAVPPLVEHRPDRSCVAGPQVVDAVVDPSLPAVTPPDRGVLDQVGQIDGEQDPALDRPPVEVVGDGSPEHPLPLGVPAPQVGVHRLAHQLVQRQPVAQRLGKAPGCKPLERLHRVGAGQHVAQEVHGGHPRRGRHARAPRRAPRRSRCRPASGSGTGPWPGARWRCEGSIAAPGRRCPRRGRERGASRRPRRRAPRRCGGRPRRGRAAGRATPARTGDPPRRLRTRLSQPPSSQARSGAPRPAITTIVRAGNELRRWRRRKGPSAVIRS